MWDNSAILDDSVTSDFADNRGSMKGVHIE